MTCLSNIIIYMVFVSALRFGSCVLLKECDTKLVLAHVLFRHGARTTYKFYPTDPHRNSTFYPVGLGGLTNEGKLGEYKLGEYLRQNYGEFLGDIYTEDILEMRSTHTTRTKMSAQLVLAGMWPPAPEQRWHPHLLWQPIPVLFKEKCDEDLLSPSTCEYRTHVLSNMQNSPEVQKLHIDPHRQLFEYITKHSGMKIRNLMDLLEFYFIISTEDEMKLPLPAWTKKIYPDPLTKTAALVYDYWNHDEGVRKINIGYLLKKILDDSFAKINNTLKPSTRKMFLYSGHESTLGYMLNVLQATQPHIPPYGSAIIFELRKDGNENYFVQVKYYRDADLGLEVLQLPGCDSLCPVSKFQQINKKTIPTVSFRDACKLK